MKTTLIITLLFLLMQATNGQNLVPNPSFEERQICGGLGDCPTGYSMICIATSWNSAKGSPDYFHACDTNMASIFGPDTGMVAVPKNNLGYQNAATGEAYAGFFSFPGYNPNNQNEREWLICQLNTPLTIGSKYSISFKVSLADSVNCSTNNIGALFSTVPVFLPVDATLNNFSHFNYSTVIEDTAVWTTINGSFFSDSAYRYLIIGNFYNNFSTDTIYYPNRPVMDNLDSTECYAYYYIDDINVQLDTVESVNNDEHYIITVFPNPVDEKLFVYLDELKKTEIKIFDAFGRLLHYELYTNKEIIIDISSFSNGLYIVFIKQDSHFIYKQIIITKK